jgi:hypothetical protein
MEFAMTASRSACDALYDRYTDLLMEMTSLPRDPRPDKISGLIERSRSVIRDAEALFASWSSEDAAIEPEIQQGWSASFHNLLGSLLIRAGRHQEAFDELQIAVETDRWNIHHLMNLLIAPAVPDKYERLGKILNGVELPSIAIEGVDWARDFLNLLLADTQLSAVTPAEVVIECLRILATGGGARIEAGAGSVSARRNPRC